MQRKALDIIIINIIIIVVIIKNGPFLKKIGTLTKASRNPRVFRQITLLISALLCYGLLYLRTSIAVHPLVERFFHDVMRFHLNQDASCMGRYQGLYFR